MRHLLRRPVLGAGALLLAPIVLRAQQPGDSTRVRLEDVVVEAERSERPVSRVAGSVTALSGARLEQTRTRNPLELLGAVPGLSVETARPGFSRFVLRGVGAGGQFGWRAGRWWCRACRQCRRPASGDS